MGCCTERRRVAAVLAALVLAAPGCFTGHLLDAARRREHPVTLRAAWVEDDRLVLAWDAEVRTDLGEPLGRVARAGAIPLATLAGLNPIAADAVDVERRDVAAPVGPGAAALALQRGTAAGAERSCPSVPETRSVPGGGPPARPAGVAACEPTIELRHAPGTPLVVLHEGGRTFAPVPLNALSSSRTAAWAWPLLPPALALDAAVVPPLLFFAPAVITMGD